MTKIGLISDTHGYLDAQVFTHFNDVDEIWHAGDFGPGVLEPLEKFKPLMAVFGNIDDHFIRSRFPEKLLFQCEDVKVMLRHIGGSPPNYTPETRKELALHSPQLFISGHSHILKIIYDKKINCLHMNPGAAGRQGWQKTRTLIRFAIEGEDIKNCEVIELGAR